LVPIETVEDSGAEDFVEVPNGPEEPSIIETVLDYIQEINDDMELFLNGTTDTREINKNLILYPNEEITEAASEFEHYLYTEALDFIKFTLKRKTHHEFGNREMLLFQTGKNIAALYERVP
jgi:hypothetical protein